jgi:hypothetical protein
MSVLFQIAHFQDRRDEVPNQELARKLAETRDQDGIQEIVQNLSNPESNIQSDCLKVLYEIGYLAPDLITEYSGNFFKLLKSRNNRMVWGAMIALATISNLNADEIYEQRDLILKTMEKGSVITVENGIKILSAIVNQKPEKGGEIFSYLIKHLETCRIQDVPRHAEYIALAVQPDQVEAFVTVLEKRFTAMNAAQAARVKRVIKSVEKRQA